MSNLQPFQGPRRWRRWRHLPRHAAFARAGAWLFWTATLVLVTVAMVSVRGELDQAHVTLIYLLVVLGGSASGGRALGFFLACGCFLLIDYYLQTPYDTLSVDKPHDWLVLLAFLVTATVATQLLGRANALAEAARSRAEEIDHLASLGAESLSVGRAEEALAAIAKVIREATGAAECAIYLGGGGTPAAAAAAAAVPAAAAAAAPEAVNAAEAVGSHAGGPGRAAGTGELVAWVAAHGRVAVEHADGTTLRSSATIGTSAGLDAELGRARALLLPLVVHEKTVGVLRLADRTVLRLDPPRRRFLDALAYYAALGLERMRLVAEAEHAEALREADRLKDALLASVSHDLRTPLTTIKALAHAIAASGDERAAVIEQQADRLNHMVADLLDLSRLNAGGLPVNLEINTGEDVVGAAIQQVAGALDGRELRTTLAWQEPMPVGRFDFVHALRILVNLIENALKYSPPDSPIDISVANEGTALAFSVADRGRGVPAAERERIFEPFYRMAGPSPDSGGSGLGLAIARRLAEAQEGTLTYAERPGGGSIFTLRLPAAPSAAEEPALPEPAATS
ncbi:MAG TPA: ATP-binding protein [Thermoanaerobaculia bacterium]|nr:ATP-binding protein [Thermoanaerobaculia bacterium]